MNDPKSFDFNSIEIPHWLDRNKFTDTLKSMNIPRDMDPRYFYEQVKVSTIEAYNIHTALQKESSRGAILIGMAYLDNLLERLIVKVFIGSNKHLKDLLSFNGPLGGLSSRVNILYSVGLLPKNIFEDLNTLRKIRNIFSHSFDIHDFSNPKIAPEIKKLNNIKNALVNTNDEAAITELLTGTIAYYGGVIYRLMLIRMPFKFADETR